MAHLLSQVLPDSPVAPIPASPIVHAGHRRLMQHRFLTAAVAWAIALSTPGLVSLPQIFAHGPMAGFGEPTVDDTTGPIVAFGVLLAGVLALFSGLFYQFDLGGHIAGWAGYGKRRHLNRDHWSLVAPPGMVWAMAMPLLVGAAVGLGVTTVGSAIRGEMVIAVGAGLGVALVSALTVPVWRRAITAITIVRETARRTARIVADGRHSVARVASTTFRDVFVDGHSEFDVDLATDHGGERSTFTLRVLEYPVWAPVPGTEYDMWTIDDRPPDIADADRIVVERRYLGQDGPQDPAAYRYSAAEGTVRLAPAWIGTDPDTIERAANANAPTERQVTAVGRTILAGLFAVSLALVVFQLAVSTLALVALCVLIAFTSLHAALGWAYARRARWIVRNAVQSKSLIPVGFLLIFMVVPMVLFDPAMLGEVIDGAPVSTAHIVTWITVGLYLVVFMFGIGMTNDPPHVFNGEFAASAEAIQHALTTHDATAVDRLEAETGVRVGVGLLR